MRRSGRSSSLSMFLMPRDDNDRLHVGYTYLSSLHSTLNRGVSRVCVFQRGAAWARRGELYLVFVWADDNV
jgi:hypothetical protein